MTDILSDESIMKNIKGGDLTGMTVIFERYHLRLFNFFIRMGVARDVSQDLTQNVFYRMIKYRATYREGSSVITWIYRIARNLHADHCQLQKKENSLFILQDSVNADIPEEKEGFFEDDYRRLETALSRLSETHREVLILSRYQGLKYAEISEILQQSVPAVKVTVHRAIRELRNIFIKQEKL